MGRGLFVLPTISADDNCVTLLEADNLVENDI